VIPKRIIFISRGITVRLWLPSVLFAYYLLKRLLNYGCQHAVRSCYPLHKKKQLFSVHEYYVGRSHCNRCAIYSCKYTLKHNMHSSRSLHIVKKIRVWDVILVTKTWVKQKIYSTGLCQQRRTWTSHFIDGHSCQLNIFILQGQTLWFHCTYGSTRKTNIYSIEVILWVFIITVTERQSKKSLLGNSIAYFGNCWMHYIHCLCWQFSSGMVFIMFSMNLLAISYATSYVISILTFSLLSITEVEIWKSSEILVQVELWTHSYY